MKQRGLEGELDRRRFLNHFGAGVAAAVAVPGLLGASRASADVESWKMRLSTREPQEYGGSEPPPTHSIALSSQPPSLLSDHCFFIGRL